MPRPRKDLSTTSEAAIRAVKPKIASVREVVKVKNLSLQGLELCFGARGKFESVWIGPRQERIVPKDHISDQILNLQNQRMIRIS